MASCSIADASLINYDNSSGGFANTSYPILGIIAAPDAYPCISEIGLTSKDGSDYNAIFCCAVSSSLGTYETLTPNFLVRDSDANDSLDTNFVFGGVILTHRWTVPPTYPGASKFIRSVAVNTNSYQGKNVSPIFRFPRGLKLAPSTALLIYDTGRLGEIFGIESGAANFYVALDG